MDYQKIKFLKDATNFKVVTEGYSGADKFLFEKEGTQYFLKIGDFQLLQNLEEDMTRAGIPHPKVVDFGSYDEHNNYIIEEFSKGEPLKKLLNFFEKKFIYEFGFKVGEGYRNLRKIYPDTPVSDDAYVEFMSEIDKARDRLLNLAEKANDKLTNQQKALIDYTLEFLNKNRNLYKNSSMIYGHTDVKPSNFLIDGRSLSVIDFEITRYKEVALSVLWTYCRADFNDDKNFSFARGYFDGLFNLNVPENVKQCTNYIYLYNMCIYFGDYINDGDYDNLDKLIKYICSNFIENGEISVDKKLFCSIEASDFIGFENYDFRLVSGSYSPNNLTFKCSGDGKEYFLKVMDSGESEIKDCLKKYKVMTECGIKISPIRGFGKCKNVPKNWIMFDYIGFPEMNFWAKDNSFVEGARLGELVGRELKKLKLFKGGDFKCFDKDNLYGKLFKMVESIFCEGDRIDNFKWNKKEIGSFINKFIKSFNDEPLSLIHGDVKFGNILFDGKEEIVFVDNESLMVSYEIINFLHNIYSGFRGGEKMSLYQGFVNGYLKVACDGEIPTRIEGQVKLLLLAKLLRTVMDYRNRRGSGENIEALSLLCEKYLENDEAILWLR